MSRSGYGESELQLGLRSAVGHVFAFGALLMLAAGIASALAPLTIPAPEFVLDVDAVQDGRVITYTIRFENVGSGPTASAILSDVFPENATYLGDSEDLVEGAWTKTYANLRPGAYFETFLVELPEGVADGDLVTNFAKLRYLGPTGGWNVASHRLEVEMSFPAAPVPTPSFPMWVAAALAVPALAAPGGFVAYRRRKAAKIEQVFLMHSSGMLIHHWAANVSPSRDIDILSGMVMVLKEFVRDSFREKAGGMTELQFGDSRLLVAEGRHSVLAAVVSGQHLNGLAGQVGTAVEDFERRSGDALRNWTGRIEHLSGAQAVVDGLVRGEYGHWRGPA